MDYFLCQPIYTYPYTINLTYYDTLVVIVNNYFSHQITELVHVPWVYVQSSIYDIDLVQWCSRDVWLITRGPMT